MCTEALYNFAAAFLTTAVISTDSVHHMPKGEEPPTSADLLKPSKNPREAALRSDNPPADEIYNEFDFRDPSTPISDPIILSYGERVENCAGIDFQPFVKSAEELARTYSDFLCNESPASSSAFELIGREWYSVTRPDLAVVHVYLSGNPI
jgi:hypothetical protein